MSIVHEEESKSLYRREKQDNFVMHINKRHIVMELVISSNIYCNVAPSVLNTWPSLMKEKLMFWLSLVAEVLANFDILASIGEPWVMMNMNEIQL